VAADGAKASADPQQNKVSSLPNLACADV